VRQLDPVTLEVVATRRPEAALPLLRRMLGLDVDLSQALRLAAADSRLRPVVQRFAGLRPPRFASLFETLGMTIPFQQVSLEAGQSFVNRLVKRFGKSRGALWLFPTPEAIANASLEDLRAAGLSEAKAATLRHVASLIVAGTLSEAEIERLPSEEALRSLDDLPGIGPWTAGVILLRGFGRLDVFPPGDVGAPSGSVLIRARDFVVIAAEIRRLEHEHNQAGLDRRRARARKSSHRTWQRSCVCGWIVHAARRRASDAACT
jgi:3-methyladenine DNA glycosylase/8-oxoguanine DNA glycosylase